MRIQLCALGAAGAVAAAACAVNPVTGERELALISEQQEVAMGREAADQVRSSMGLVDDESLQQYVSDIGGELAATSERPDLPWAFGVVDDPAPNAFALPGGYIYVTRGLLALMESEAELAAVLGHEIGHVTARHSVNQISRAQLAQLGLGLGIAVEPDLRQVGDLANTGLSLLFLRYGREDERQADELGFRYMLDHGYDVREMGDVFAALQSSSELAGATPTPGWLASHPSPPDRIAALDERVARLETPPGDRIVNAERYVGEIDGLVYGADPRHGYFAGGTFYHPELAFQFAVPAGWNRQNLSSAVVASSETGDAALELTLANGSVDEAARAFFGAESIAEVESERTRLNGRDTVVSRFRAALDGGAAVGYATHVRHGGTTFRLLAYAPEAAFASHSGVLRDIATSFGPVTAPSALDVEARRLEIVELDREMTLEEFERRYPSEIGLAELAVINQVDGARSVLDAGTYAKRVN